MFFVGIDRNRKYVSFSCSHVPTVKSHGEQFVYTIGPFKSKKGQLWAATYGKDNPHFRHVADAEHIGGSANVTKARAQGTVDQK